jgi:hypothetical protein
MFGITKETVENSNPVSIPSLEPGIYDNVTLEKVTYGAAEKKDGSAGKNLINFEFKTEDGRAYTHSEWALDATPENADKAANLSKRVAHIMTKFMDKDKTVSPAFTSFDDFGNWVVKTLAPAKAASKVKFKICGSVYNGKKKSGFPQYVGFIVKAGEQLSFSAGEIKGNQEWSAFVPTKEADNGVSPTAVTEEF